jgi:hypothetical protein
MSNEDPQEGDSAAEAMRLIDEDPQALTKVDAFGRTPLHCAVDYRSDASEIIMVLLHRSPINVIGTQATNGFTPLHYACERGAFLHAIRLMSRLYPKALKMLNNTREPPLHVACRYPYSSLEMIRFLIDQCPALCLLVDNYYKFPNDKAARRRRAGDILYVLAEATKEAATSLLVCLDSSIITAPPAVVAHIQRVMPEFSTEGFSLSYMRSNETVRQSLNDLHTLKSLLINRDIQEMLKDRDNQDLICILLRLVKAGSRIQVSNEDDQPETKDHAHILELVSDAPDCLYLHLRSNPSLCCRSTVGRRPEPATVDQSSTTSEVVEEEAPNEETLLINRDLQEMLKDQDNQDPI